jgi:hypothetical protein
MTQTMTVSIDGVDVELPVLPGRRVAACVNACEGIDQEVLQDAIAPGLIKRMVANEMRRVTAERDELLAALTGLVLFTKPKPFNSLALHNAHRVIALATGGAK